MFRKGSRRLAVAPGRTFVSPEARGLPYPGSRSLPYAQPVLRHLLSFPDKARTAPSVRELKALKPGKSATLLRISYFSDR